MLVSFIIVAYNAENSINNVMQNLIDQDYNHRMIEVILVDSDSSDNTKLIMDEFKNAYYKDFKRVVVLDNVKKILPCGWNIALKEVSGDVIIRVDAHATIPSNFISINVGNIERGEEICGGKVNSIADEKSAWQNTLLLAENSMFGGGAAKFRRSKSAEYVDTLAFAAYKRCVFESVGGYDERLARTEDNEIHYRMKKAGYKFYYDPTIQLFRQSRSNLSKLLKQKFLNGYWIGLTIGICPKCFSIYHLVPCIFVLAIIFTTLLFLVGYWQLSILMWTLYFMSNIAITLMSIDWKRLRIQMTLLPVIFLLLHICYGLGTVIGLIKLPLWKKTHPTCYEIDIVKALLLSKRVRI